MNKKKERKKEKNTKMSQKYKIKHIVSVI